MNLFQIVFKECYQNSNGKKNCYRKMHLHGPSDTCGHCLYLNRSHPDSTKNDSIIMAMEIIIRLGPAGLIGMEALSITVNAGVASCNFAIAACI